jgi:serine/threonine protein kinase
MPLPPDNQLHNKPDNNEDGDESTLLVDIASGQNLSGFAQQGALAEQFRPGEIIDGTYRLNEKLGAGGMGVVFSCTHLGLQKDYAIKLLSGRGVTVDMWHRFQKEAKVLARLNAHGIVAVHNMGVHEGKVPYLIMDLLSSESMSEVIRKSGPLPVKTNLRLFIQVAYALVAAHVQGIVHRDIKPANLMVVRNQGGKIESIKIVDFGIARWSKQGLGAQSETAVGTAVGTPFYMSPEQCQGSQIDLRSDIYSLGCTMFEALTGAPPFRGENAFQTFMMHQSQTPPKLGQRLPRDTFPPALERILDKMLAKNPADRYQSAEEIARELTDVRRSMSEDANSRTAPYDTQRLDNRIDSREAESEAEASAPQIPVKILCAAAAICVFIAVASLGVISLLGQNRHMAGAPSEGVKETQASIKKESIFNADPLGDDPISTSIRLKFERLKVNSTRIDHFIHYKLADADEDQDKATAKLEQTIAERLAKHKMWFDRKLHAYDFPINYFVGHISFTAKTPSLATGTMPKPPGDAVFYQNYCLRGLPQYVKLFADGDIDGLEIQVKRVPDVLEHIKGWKGIKHLSFFNSLVTPFPDQHNYDESSLEEEDLKYLKTLPNLKVLGLCRVNAAAVRELSCLPKLKSLRLQRVPDIQRLLNDLPKYDNIEELWLLNIKMENADLEPLTRMKNLKSLRLSRDKIDGNILPYLKQMKSLQKISLDDYLEPAIGPQLRAVVPDVSFSCPVQDTYWQVKAGKPVSEYF